MSMYSEYVDPLNNKHENYWIKLEHLARYLFVAKELNKKENIVILDIGCANGYGSNILARAGNKVIGCDRNEDYLKEARQNANPKINFRKVDLDNDRSNIDSEQFDSIVCFETIEHLSKPLEALEFLINHLKRRGTMYLSFPNKRWESFDENGVNKDPYHISLIDLELVKRLLDDRNMKYKIYGQAFVNTIFNREHSWVKQGVYSREKLDSFYDYDPKKMKYFAMLLAEPNAKDIDDSYSYFMIITF